MQSQVFTKVWGFPAFTWTTLVSSNSWLIWYLWPTMTGLKPLSPCASTYSMTSAFTPVESVLTNRIIIFFSHKKRTGCTVLVCRPRKLVSFAESVATSGNCVSCVISPKVSYSAHWSCPLSRIFHLFLWFYIFNCIYFLDKCKPYIL